MWHTEFHGALIIKQQVVCGRESGYLVLWSGNIHVGGRKIAF